MPHFVWGGDETGLQASNGDVKIIGDKEKKKHEVQSANSRTSVTLYRVGNTAGTTGPIRPRPQHLRPQRLRPRPQRLRPRPQRLRPRPHLHLP